jgi:hypothetical protein
MSYCTYTWFLKSHLQKYTLYILFLLNIFMYTHIWSFNSITGVWADVTVFLWSLRNSPIYKLKESGEINSGCRRLQSWTFNWTATCQALPLPDLKVLEFPFHKWKKRVQVSATQHCMEDAVPIKVSWLSKYHSTSWKSETQSQELILKTSLLSHKSAKREIP